MTLPSGDAGWRCLRARRGRVVGGHPGRYVHVAGFDGAIQRLMFVLAYAWYTVEAVSTIREQASAIVDAVVLIEADICGFASVRSPVVERFADPIRRCGRSAGSSGRPAGR